VPEPRRRRSLSRRITVGLWICAGFFMLGYVPTVIWKDPRISLVLAAGAIIPVGSRLSSPVRAGVYGALLGLAAGASAFGTMMSLRVPVTVTAPPAAATQLAPASTCSSPVPAMAPNQPASAPVVEYVLFPKPFTTSQLTALAIAWIGGPALLCAAISATFAQVAKSRRRFIDRQWDRL